MSALTTATPVDAGLVRFLDRGWCRFGYDPALARWVSGALPAARAAVRSPQYARWLRCGGTWFAGVNALGNDAGGAVGRSGPLRGEAVDFIHHALGLTGFEWDQGQVSVCYPRYPRPMSVEPPAAFRYRRERDAAHVDGLLPEGPERRRHLREHHGFILGVPMVEFSAGASPFVLWEGSHDLVRRTLAARFEGLDPRRWGDEDITAVYHRLRREIFARCRRVEMAARPGEAYLVHRLVLHGMAPWDDSASAGADGRMICYFRPDLGDPLAWLNAP